MPYKTEQTYGRELFRVGGVRHVHHTQKTFIIICSEFGINVYA